MREHLTEFELGYIAGFLDGEGHITIMRSLPKGRKLDFHSIQIVLANTKVEVLEWIRERIGGAIYCEYPKGNRKPGYRLVLSGQKSRGFLMTIAPHVLIKREQVAIALSYLDLPRFGSRVARAEMCDRMRRLNKRGKVEQRNGPQPDDSQTKLH